MLPTNTVMVGPSEAGGGDIGLAYICGRELIDAPWGKDTKWHWRKSQGDNKRTHHLRGHVGKAGHHCRSTRVGHDRAKLPDLLKNEKDANNHSARDTFDCTSV